MVPLNLPVGAIEVPLYAVRYESQKFAHLVMAILRAVWMAGPRLPYLFAYKTGFSPLE